MGLAGEEPDDQRLRPRPPVHAARAADAQGGMMSPAPIVSFLIAAYNRRDVLLTTLARLQHNGLPRDQFEIIVVDNASTDGTADAAARSFPSVRVLRQCENRGACAKNAGLSIARGRFIVFL